MKVLLIQPPLPNFEEDPYPPLGLGYIASVLEKNGYNVKIIDMPILQLSMEKVKTLLGMYKPSIVGISCVAANYNYSIRISRIVKATLPTSIVIMGGPHATFIPSRILQKHPTVDIIVRGEGEETMLELVRTIEKYGYKANKLKLIRGIHFRDEKGEVAHTEDRELIEDLDTLPYPARHLLPMDKYKSLTKYTSIVASRGCPYSCIYCSASAFWRHRVRLRKPLEIVKEIEFVKNEFGFDHFKFVDDNFLFPSKWTIKVLSLLNRLDIKWICNARIDKVSKDIIKKEAEVGCEKIIFGIETLSPRVQRLIGKNIDIDRNKMLETLRVCRKNNIRTKLNFIIGLPGQDRKDIDQINDLLNIFRPDEVAINLLTPYPGTRIFYDIKSSSIDDSLYWWETKLNKNRNRIDLLSKEKIVREIYTVKDFVSSLGIKVMEGY